MATPMTSYPAQASYPGPAYPAPVYSAGPQSKWAPTTNSYPSNANASPYHYAAMPQKRFGPQAGFSPGPSPYAYQAPQQLLQQPYPQVYQPAYQQPAPAIIQYIPVVRPPAKTPEATLPPSAQVPPESPVPSQKDPSPHSSEINAPVPKESKPEKAPPEHSKPEEPEAPLSAKTEAPVHVKTKLAPADFAEETGNRVGTWITDFLKEHPEWESKIKQFDLPSHLDTLGQGLATGQMPNFLENVRGQFHQSWLLRHALPWLEKPLLTLCPFEYRIPLSQFFKWLKGKPEVA